MHIKPKTQEKWHIALVKSNSQAKTISVPSETESQESP